ncbi:MAG: Crp/Fnr family transcriptional regulator [Lachnospiraceae bacterium]|nr:Crp/Fnr family transcriptional regulator [Lachnospiraceae bacterium]
MNSKILSNAYPFWNRLSEKEKNEIIKECVEVTYEKGMNVYRSEMECRGAILLLSGVLRIYIISEEGREVTLFRIHKGENCVLSASCLLESIQFDILIEATEKAEAIVIPTHILHPIMEHNPYVGLYMYKQATERFSDVMWTMQQILFMSADKRVAIFLWDEIAHQKQLTLKITHEEIAKNIGSAREVVTKVLKYFSKEGVVSLGRGKVEILEKEKLRKYL